MLMKHSIHGYVGVLVATLGFLVGCKHTAPTQTNHPNRVVASQPNEGDLQRRVRLATLLFAPQADSFTYAYIQGKDTNLVQIYRAVTELLPTNGFRRTEFSGRFEDEYTRQIVFSGIEYSIFDGDSADTRDSIIRPVREFQVKLGAADTAVLQRAETAYALAEIKTLSVKGRSIRIYKLIGLEGTVANYAHTYETGLALPASDHRYWTPEYGNILTYFGNDTSFELIATSDPDETELLAALRKEIRKAFKENS